MRRASPIQQKGLDNQQKDNWDSKGGKTLPPPSFGLSSGPIQRVVEDPNQNELGTINSIKKKGGNNSQYLADAKKELEIQLGFEVTDKKFEDYWNKLRNSKEKFILGSDTESRKPLVEALATRAARSKKSSEGNQKRNNFCLEMQQQMNLSKDFSLPNFLLDYSPQNPKLILEKMGSFDFDTNMSGANKLQRHLSTMILSHYTKGVESQASLSKDGKEIFIGTNNFGENNDIRDEVSSTKDVLSLTAGYLNYKEIDKKSTSEINNDRQLRHHAKLLIRDFDSLQEIQKYVVPKINDSKLDGKHIETQFVDEKGWNDKDFNMPSGTRPPCLGCYSHMLQKGLDPGKEFGPLWLTSASIKNQLIRHNHSDFSVGKITSGHDFLKNGSDELLKSFGKGMMGYGKHKDKKEHDEFDADSDDDLRDEEVEKLKIAVQEYPKVPPKSTKGKRKQPKEAPKTFKEKMEPLVNIDEKEDIKKKKPLGSKEFSSNINPLKEDKMVLENLEFKDLDDDDFEEVDFPKKLPIPRKKN